jgi:hypothetical protein
LDGAASTEIPLVKIEDPELTGLFIDNCQSGFDSRC